MRIVLTPRLCLEPQIAAHAVEMFAVLSDPAIYEFENAPPASVEWLRQRFSRLETRRSPDGSEHWLNWVVRLPSSGLVGYVQATVSAGANAAIAYELSSRYWGMGLGREAVGVRRSSGDANVGQRQGSFQIDVVCHSHRVAGQRLRNQVLARLASAIRDGSRRRRSHCALRSDLSEEVTLLLQAILDAARAFFDD